MTLSPCMSWPKPYGHLDICFFTIRKLTLCFLAVLLRSKDWRQLPNRLLQRDIFVDGYNHPFDRTQLLGAPPCIPWFFCRDFVAHIGTSSMPHVWRTTWVQIGHPKAAFGGQRWCDEKGWRVFPDVLGVFVHFRHFQTMVCETGFLLKRFSWPESFRSLKGHGWALAPFHSSNLSNSHPVVCRCMQLWRALMFVKMKDVRIQDDLEAEGANMLAFKLAEITMQTANRHADILMTHLSTHLTVMTMTGAETQRTSCFAKHT